MFVADGYSVCMAFNFVAAEQLSGSLVLGVLSYFDWISNIFPYYLGIWPPLIWIGEGDRGRIKH